MDKLAQKRSLKQKFKEVTDISGQLAERKYEQLGWIMNAIRDNDNEIRAIVTGKKIERLGPGEDAVSLKDLIKTAKHHLNKSQFMMAVSELGRFHKKIDEVRFVINKFIEDDERKSKEKEYHSLLFTGLKHKPLERIKSLHERFAELEHEINKEAGFLDFMSEKIFGGEAEKGLMRAFPKLVTALKERSLDILNKSQELYNTILAVLEKMAEARISRNVDNYLNLVSGLEPHLKQYHAHFESYYKEAVKPFVEKSEVFSPKKEVEEEHVEPVAVKPDSEYPATKSHPPVTKISPVPSAKPSSSEALTPVAPTSLAPLTPTPTQKIEPPTVKNTQSPDTTILLSDLPEESGVQTKTKEEQAPETQRSPGAVGRQLELNLPEVIPPTKRSHIKFIQSLEKLSNESPILIKNLIKKYANQIKDNDPESAIKLYKIIKG